MATGTVSITVTDAEGHASAPAAVGYTVTSSSTDPFFVPPSGYTSFHAQDFTQLSALPALWAPRAGKTISEATFRSQNVAVIPGVGLVLTANRAGPGQTLYSGAVNGNIAMPQHYFTRCILRTPEFQKGSFPSYWWRPQGGGTGEGEIDHFEGFGAHIDGSGSGTRISGMTIEGTPYGSGEEYARSDDYGLTAAQLQVNHLYEHRKTLNLLEGWVDGVAQTPLSRATTSNPTGKQISQAKWDAQMEGTGTWYCRFDFQVGDGTNTGNAGPAPTGAFTWTQVIEKIVVFVPTS